MITRQAKFETFNDAAVPRLRTPRGRPQLQSQSSGAVASQPLPHASVEPELQSPQLLHASHDCAPGSGGATASQPLPQASVEPKLQSPQLLHASHEEPTSGGGIASQPLPQSSVVPKLQPQPLHTWHGCGPGSDGATASHTPDEQVSSVPDAQSPQALHAWHDCVPHGWQPLPLATYPGAQVQVSCAPTPAQVA
jgi:hypothetical protein